MDANHFDQFARSLTDIRPRRGVLAILVGGALGLIGLSDAAAKRGKKGKKGKKKKKGGNRPTCSDGVKNGSETGIDCGGGCPRCTDGAGCASRNDCVSNFCTDETCQTCTAFAACGEDASGTCRCRPVAGSNVCTKGASSTGPGLVSCDECPPGTSCVSVGGGAVACYKPCGAS